MRLTDETWKPRKHPYRKRVRDQTKAVAAVSVRDTPLADLDLNARIVNMMERAGYILVRDLEDLTADVFARMENFGEDSLVKLRKAILKKGVPWGVTVGAYRKAKRKLEAAEAERRAPPAAARGAAKDKPKAAAPPSPPTKKPAHRQHRVRRPYKGMQYRPGY